MKIATIDKCPNMVPAMTELYMSVWPKYIGENPHPHTQRILSELTDYQLVAFEGEELAAAGNTVPVSMKESDRDLPAGWDSAMEQSMDDIDSKHQMDTLVGLAVGIPVEFRKKGISGRMVEAMKRLAADKGLSKLVIPVRPTLKHRYPLTPMERFVSWKKEDGSPFDPWLRVHWRAGGITRSVSTDSMTIEGTVSKWEEWTGLKFFESGRYIVEGALNPVLIDIEQGTGKYVEENVWVEHSI